MGLMSPSVVIGQSRRIRAGDGSRVIGIMDRGVNGGLPVIGDVANRWPKKLVEWSPAMMPGFLLGKIVPTLGHQKK